MKNLLFMTVFAFGVSACSGTASDSPKSMESKPVQQETQKAEPQKTEKKGETKAENVEVEIKTSMGDISVALNADKAPISVANFLSYVDDGFYDGTVFHRVISTFMIQGGGFSATDSDTGYTIKKKDTKKPIKLEAAFDTGLTNARGTIAMARTNVPDSATAQFFINVVDNKRLDKAGGGYAVFGKVTSGIEVADKIKAVSTGRNGGMNDVPVQKVEILSIKRK